MTERKTTPKLSLLPNSFLFFNFLLCCDRKPPSPLQALLRGGRAEGAQSTQMLAFHNENCAHIRSETGFCSLQQALHINSKAGDTETQTSVGCSSTSAPLETAEILPPHRYTSGVITGKFQKKKHGFYTLI